jgi:CelD/BcsL family acetyltransferase involved in cellulose biosynthesis
MNPAGAAPLPPQRNSAAAAQASSLRVETISGEREFHALEPAWNSLMEEAGPLHPFLSYEWVRTWWDHFGAGRQLHVIVVKEGARPVALLPLMLTHGNLYGERVRRLESIGTAHTQRFDLLASGRLPEVYRTIWEVLLRQRRLWDVLILSQVPAGSPTVAVLSELARRRGLLYGLWRPPDSPYITLSSSWDDYYERLPASLRVGLHRDADRLSQLGPVRMETVSREADAPAAVREVLRIEASMGRSRSATSIAFDPAKRSFYTTLAQRAARRGWLSLHFLTWGGKPIAFDYSLVSGRRVYSLKSGHDPEYTSFSPSGQLLFRSLQTHAAHAVNEFDFLGQSERWMVDWATRLRPHQWLYVMPSSRRMRLLCFAKFRLVPRLQRHRSFVLARHAALAMARSWPVRRRPGWDPVLGKAREDGLPAKEETE